MATVSAERWLPQPTQLENPLPYTNIPLRSKRKPYSSVPVWRWLTPQGLDLLVIAIATCLVLVAMVKWW